MTEVAAIAPVGDAACSSAAAATRSHLASTTEAVAVADEVVVVVAADVAGDPRSTTMGMVMHTTNMEDHLNQPTAAATVAVGAAVDKETTVAVRLLVVALLAATVVRHLAGLRTAVAMEAAHLLATAAAHLAVGMVVAPLLGMTMVDTVATAVARRHLLEVTEAMEETEEVRVVVVPRGVAEVQEDVTRTLARSLDCLS
jgi:hypothetical protein